MSKLIIINLGNGELNKGFPTVTVQLRGESNSRPQQFIGSLPPAPDLIQLYRYWQSIYQSICARKEIRTPSEEPDDELEILEEGITNVSVISFEEVCQNLGNTLNTWLNSEEFSNLEKQLRSQLFPNEEIQLILETNDNLIRRLPWQHWDLFNDYPRAELGISLPEYKHTRSSLAKGAKKKVRILAILGNSQGIELETETQFLKNLPDAEIEFIVKPSRQELNTQLWDEQGWDLLFFAGHSQTEGETGRIYINENEKNNSLTVEQLEEALKHAIENGLKLAIFNSCDGLGLAITLEKLNIPTVIVMREPVPNGVAQVFFKHFLEAFAIKRLSLYLSVQQARRKLQGLENDFPAASWLPVICQNPAVEPPTWLQLGGIPPCPYRGLFAFREADAHLFFGREQLTQDLVKAVKKKPLVAVVGPSGSGKSSVVFAGLVPQLRHHALAQWEIISFRPGNNPIEALAVAILPLLQQYGEENNRRLMELELAIAFQQDDRALYKIIESFVQRNPTQRVLLIVDQFEEIYTQTLQTDYQLFLNGLLNCVRLAPGFSLVLTLRADFYGYALSDRLFSDALQGAVFNLGPMSREELKKAIEQPAIKMQVELEKGLTNKLIDNVEGQAGRLPLLEFALTTLWSKIQNGVLTHQAYEEIGGVEEALANHAESVYAQLCEADRDRAQRVFMQLVHLGEGAEATRQLATREEVKEENWDLVTRLASSRLVVTNRNFFTEEETVEIVHEALIRSWGRLERWMEVNGEFRRWQEQLRAARRTWENSDQDEGALLRGKPLVDAEYWQHQHGDELSLRDANFIEASLALRQREIQKQKRIRQLRISMLTGGLVSALLLAGLAFWQWHNSAIRELQAISASSEALFTLNRQLEALTQAIKAQQQLKKLGGVDSTTQMQALKVLQQAVYGMVEYNNLSGHEAEVWGVAFSPEGGIIATASEDKTVKLWNSHGTSLRTINAHNAGTRSIAFSPDGSLIATASADKTVKLWNSEGILLRIINGHTDAVNSVAFHPNGQVLATASADKTVKIWNKDGHLLQTITGHSRGVWGIAFSLDGQIIASTSEDKTVKLWQLDGTLLNTLKGHTAEVWGVAFSPDSKLIATASADNTVKLWQLNGRLVHTLRDHSSAVWAVAFSRDGRTLTSASWDGTIKFWNPTHGTLMRTFRGHSDRIRGIAFSADGKSLASASEDKTVKLLKIDNPLLITLNGHSDHVIAVAFSPDHQLIASASDDNVIKLWNHQGSLLRILKGHNAGVLGVSFSPDGKTIASASWDGTIKLWNLSGTLLKTLQEHQGVVWGVTFSPDGKLMASHSADKTIKLWYSDGTLYKTITGHSGEVKAVSFSPDGHIIASASLDKTVKLWNRNGILQKTLIGHNAGVNGVKFSPDAQILASASEDNTVKLWTRDGKLQKTLEGHSGGVRGVAFSPNSQIVASASTDNTVKLWKRDGSLFTTLRKHSNAVWAVAFSPDGKTLASASDDKTVILWNKDRILSLNLLIYACDWARDYLKNNPNIGEADRDLCDHKF